MIYECVASFPREAQKSQNNYINRIKNFLKNPEIVIKDHVSINYKSKDDGYWWEIAVSEKLQKLIDTKKAEYLADIPEEYAKYLGGEYECNLDYTYSGEVWEGSYKEDSSDITIRNNYGYGYTEEIIINLPEKATKAFFAMKKI